MLLLGALLALAIGVTLGMLGGGGSILTLPLLVFVLAVEPRAAIATSLLVVAVTSIVGLVSHARGGRVRWITGLVLGVSGVAGASLGARAAHHIPSGVLLVAFAVVMLGTAARMLSGRADTTVAREATLLVRVAIGAGIGVVSGLVGAGGGFLVVPALVAFAALPMRDAVGTSLLVIAMQATAGFLGHVGHVTLDVPLVATITIATAIGGLLGARFSARLNAETLRRGFGLLVLVTALAMLLKQAPRALLNRPETALVAIAALAVAVSLVIARPSVRA